MEENPNAVRYHCLIHREALGFDRIELYLLPKKINLQQLYGPSTTFKKVLSIQNCLSSFLKTWIPIMRLFFFMHLFNDYQKLTCWPAYMK